MTQLGVLRQYMASIFVSIVVIQCGLSYFWMSPYMNLLRSDKSQYKITPMELTWAVSLVEIGDAAAPIPTGILANKIGRKPCVFLTGPTFLISWVILYFGSSTLYLFAARLFQGLGVGMAFTALPMYVSELAEPSRRGQLNSLFHGMWVIGLLVAYAVGPHISMKLFFLMSSSACLVFLLLIPWIPESPYYLLYKQKEKEARKSLIWFRGTEDVDMEIKKIEESLLDEEPGIKALCAPGPARKALILSLILMLTSAMMGLTAILSYAKETFVEIGGNADSNSVVMAAILLTTPPLTALLIDRFGRRILILTSSASTLFCFSGTTMYYLASHAYNLDHISWLPVSLIIIAAYVNSVGVTPTVNVIIAEVFPTKTRGLGIGLSTVLFDLVSFLSLELYGFIKETVGLELIFGLYALFSAITFLYVLHCVPETKGKTFMEIQLMLQSNVKFLPK